MRNKKPNLPITAEEKETVDTMTPTVSFSSATTMYYLYNKGEDRIELY